MSGKYPLLGLFLLAALPRVVYVFWDGSYREPGAAEMILAARALFAKGYIGDVYPGVDAPTAHVAPLYPGLAAATYRLVGSVDKLPLSLLTVAVTSLAIALIPALARATKLSTTAGYLAAVAMAISPLNLWIETSGDWEQPWVALSLLLLLLLTAEQRKRGWRSARGTLLYGVLLGLGALLSPIVLLTGLCVLAAEGMTRSTAPRRLLTSGITSCCIAVGIITPWLVRNHVVLGGFVPIRSNFGLELRLGNNSQSDGTAEPVISEVHPFLNRTVALHVEEVGEVAFMREQRELATEWIRQHPLSFLELTLTRFRLFFFPPTRLFTTADARALFVKPLSFSLLGGLTLVGLAYLCWIRNEYRWTYVGLVVGASWIYLVSHVNMRYRYPIAFASFLLAAQTITAGWVRWSHRRRRS